MGATVARSVRPITLVWGEDGYSVAHRARGLYAQWCQEVGGLDHEVIDAAAGHAGEALRAVGRLREALQTLPFFGSGKVIWFQNCSFLGDERVAAAQAVTEVLGELAQELAAFPWDNVRLLISAAKVDKRRVFYKTIEKLGEVEPCRGLSLDDRDWEERAADFVTGQLGALGKTITGVALAQLVTSVGPSLAQLQSEAAKVALYAGTRSAIETGDVMAVVARNKQARAFALGDALGDRDVGRLLRALDEELWEMQSDRQRSEIGILYGLIAKMRAILLARALLDEGLLRPSKDFTSFKAQLGRLPSDRFPADRRFNPLGLNPYVLFRATSQAGNYSAAELARAMERLLRCNQELVTSTLDETVVLERALVEICRRDSSVRRSTGS